MRDAIHATLSKATHPLTTSQLMVALRMATFGQRKALKIVLGAMVVDGEIAQGPCGTGAARNAMTWKLARITG